MDDPQVLGQIQQMIEDEHRLRDRMSDPDTDREAARNELARLEERLDQCWDLLRQRRARREFGENPDDATVRPASEVEAYRQ